MCSEKVRKVYYYALEEASKLKEELELSCLFKYLKQCSGL